MQMELGLDIIRSYKRLSYTAWHALAELVDNSTQSYFNNSEVLDRAFEKENEKLEVSIVYDKESGLIRVADNSIGMSGDELRHALRIGAKPAIDTGRSQFGMGLKTAACWLGNCWSVRTKRLGETDEFSVLIDVEAVAEGRRDLPTKVNSGLSPDLHYTIIEIRDLNRNFHGRTLGKIRQFLSSMYRVDLRSGMLVLRWQDSVLTWEDSEDRFIKAADGQVYRKAFEFQVGGKNVTGWMGVLALGHGGRPYAGFSILRRGRVIKGFPESWRPESIFGQIQGSNDLINQRLTGEIHLDDFDVSHTKDDIQWVGNEEAEIQEQLKEVAAPYIAVARKPGRSDGPASGPTDVEVKSALDELKIELTSSEMADLLTIEEVPPPEVVKQTLEPMLSAAETRVPDFEAPVGKLEVFGYMVSDGSPNDPYVTVDSASQVRVVVIVNMLHPFFGELAGSEGVLNFLRHCTFDAIAEWQARQMSATIDPETITILKDRLLRLPSRLEMKSG